MSAVRAACALTGGRIRVFSEPGERTRLPFTWPVAALFASPSA